jgi:Skp family chaperone for outer membrane proteins
MSFHWLLPTGVYLFQKIPQIIATIALLIAAFITLVVLHINKSAADTAEKVVELNTVLGEHRHAEAETRGLLSNVDRLQAKIAVDEAKNKELLDELKKDQQEEKALMKTKSEIENNASKDIQVRRWPHL